MSGDEVIADALTLSAPVFGASIEVGHFILSDQAQTRSWRTKVHTDLRTEELTK